MRKLLFLIVLITLSIPTVSARTWTTDTRLTYDPEISEAQDMVVDQFGRVHVVWRSSLREGETDPTVEAINFIEYGEIFYLQLDEEGNVTVGPIKVTSKANSRGYHGPSLVVDTNDDIHILWDDWIDGTASSYGEVYYTKLDAHGNILISPYVILSNRSYISTIDIDKKGNLHLGWTDFYRGEGRFITDVHYSKLDNRGVKTETDRKLTIMQTSFEPLMVVDHDDAIHIVYMNWGDPDNEIRYTKLDNSGEIVVNDIKLFVLNDSTLRPYSVGLDPEDNLHIVFESWDPFSPTNIYYSKLDKNGVIQSDRIKITSNTGGATYPNIAVDHNGGAHVVWQDKRDENSEIYYSIIEKDGQLISTNFRLTNDTGISSTPVVGVDGKGDIHVVWSDDRDGNFEVYYKKQVSFKADEITPRILSKEQAGITPETEPKALQKFRDSAITMVFFILLIALIILSIRFYKRKAKPKKEEL